MASSFLKGFSSSGILFLCLLVSFHCSNVLATKFEVGGENGWAIPQPKDEDHFNDWASKNRFKVNDTLYFKYTKDSVLEVTEQDYEKCRTTHPIFFSNNGDILIVLDRPELYYFISGVGGHCERGLKMVVKVLGSAKPPQSANDTTPSSNAPPAFSTISISTRVMMFFILGFGAIFM